MQFHEHILALILFVASLQSFIQFFILFEELIELFIR
jgi:hypothetical protein